MNAGNAIYNILSNNAGVTAIVGTGSNCRIYPLHVAQNKAMPFIAYGITNVQPRPSKTSASTLDTYTVQVNCYTKMSGANAPYTQVNQLADAVRAALDKVAQGTYGGINVHACDFRSQRDDYFLNAQEDGAMMISMEFSLWILN